MKKTALLFLLSFGVNAYSNTNQPEKAKNEFVTTNRQEDLAEIGKLTNSAIQALYSSLPQESLEKPEGKKAMEEASKFLKDTKKMDAIVAGKLNDNEVKALLILLRKISTVKELQYIPMMLAVLMVKAKDFMANNKDSINAGLKLVMVNCANTLEVLNS